MHLFCLIFALVITAGYKISIVITQEPACPRFHYEEKIMEKVIRLEIKFEQFVQEIKQWMEESEHKAAVSKGDMNASVTKPVKEKVQNNLHSTKVTPSISTVAFNARQNGSSSLAMDDIVVFDIVMENTPGGSYDSKTGIFTAPQSGLYYFSTHMCLDSRKGGVNFAIVVNKERLAVSSLYTMSGKNSCSSVSAVATMRSNENAFVKILYHSYIMNTNAFRWSTFVGALLR